MKFVLSSPAFNNYGVMPKKYTCEGKNVSPPLKWKGAPKGTMSFALTVEDPDAPDPKHPKTVWDHWVIYNIPGDKEVWAEDYGDLPVGSCHGLNSWKKIGYSGPCPPTGRHWYIFTLYALGQYFENSGKPTKTKLLAQIEPYLLASAKLMCTYELEHGRAVSSNM